MTSQVDTVKHTRLLTSNSGLLSFLEGLVFIVLEILAFSPYFTSQTASLFRNIAIKNRDNLQSPALHPVLLAINIQDAF